VWRVIPVTVKSGLGARACNPGRARPAPERSLGVHRFRGWSPKTADPLVPPREAAPAGQLRRKERLVGPFNLSPSLVKEALQDAWGEEYTCFTFADGVWSAHSRQAPHTEKITGSNPDELTANIKRDYLRRHGAAGIPPQRGPSGVGPS
jgi:hypothetical protein